MKGDVRVSIICFRMTRVDGLVDLERDSNPKIVTNIGKG